MAIRTINISVSFDMSDIPSSAVITPKETVKTMVINEMMEFFGNDEGFWDLDVDVVDDGVKMHPSDYIAQNKNHPSARRLIEPDDFEM